MKTLAVLVLSTCMASALLADDATSPSKSFNPTWSSLESNYQCPDWFRDAKFGIWAHWSAQCVPEQGDWYAHYMYVPTHRDYAYQVEHYGHPSEVGFKEIDNMWHAENWEPDKLIDLYKRAGAKYFVALANHHDNFDNWNSKFHEWNSVNIGPKKDIVGIWAAAARKAGLRFGVSVHSATSWTWFEVSRNSDPTGPKAGIPYDGWLTKDQGNGKWWEGFDPALLYNPHPAGAAPSKAYIDDFYNRSIDLIDQHHPDLVYYDDSILPLYEHSDVGLRIAAHYYNASQQWHDGKLDAVINTKRLDKDQRKALVWDIERSLSGQLEPLPWQTCSCLGYWHYQRSLFETHAYKPARQVIHLLADIVSKNGNLLLSVPLRGDGTIDSDERQILEDVAKWMKINGECIFGTRPWRVYGEGPSVTETAEMTRFGGTAESRTAKPYTSSDFRFTTKRDTLYAIALEWPDNGLLRIQSLTNDAFNPNVMDIRLLGVDAPMAWTQTARGLEVRMPKVRPCDYCYVLKIATDGATVNK
jgi:alpha-L-fucosidase